MDGLCDCGHLYSQHHTGHGCGLEVFSCSICGCPEFSGELTEEWEPEEDFPEPSHDDTVYFCPDCETPNQFGELCFRCQRDRELDMEDPE